MSDTVDQSNERKAPVGFIGNKPGKAEYSSLDTTWQTPQYILERVRKYFGGPIPCDVATASDNPTEAVKFFTKEDDALSIVWPKEVFCNPPYGRVLKDWLSKFWEEASLGKTILGIIPAARWEQSYFTSPFAYSKHVCFIRGRVNFIRASTGDAVNGNPYATMIIGWNTNEKDFTDAFGDLGCCIEVMPLAYGPDKPNRPPRKRKNAKG